MRANTLLAFLLWTPFCMPAFAQSYPDSTSLKGLKGVMVRTFTERPLSDRAFREKVEMRLTRSGVSVLTEKEGESTPGAPSLALNVFVVCDGETATCAWHVRLQLSQDVRLARDPQIVTRGITWENSYTRSFGNSGTVAQPTLSFASTALLTVDVGTLVEGFVNDMLAANRVK